MKAGPLVEKQLILYFLLLTDTAFNTRYVVYRLASCDSDSRSFGRSADDVSEELSERRGHGIACKSISLIRVT